MFFIRTDKVRIKRFPGGQARALTVCQNKGTQTMPRRPIQGAVRGRAKIASCRVCFGILCWHLLQCILEVAFGAQAFGYHRNAGHDDRSSAS